MKSRGGEAQDSAALLQRDEGWLLERRREVLRFMAEVERRTILANFLGVIIIVGFAQLLPNGQDFVLPGIGRFLVIFGTSLVYERMRERLAKNESIEGIYHLCILIGVVAGASWAWLLLPVFLAPTFGPASLLVCSATLIAISLVVSNTSSLLAIWLPYGISFLVTFWIGILQAPEGWPLPTAMGVTIIYLAVAGFSRGTAIQRIAAADMIVQNNRLGEELTEALEQAEFLANRDPLTGLFNRRAVFDSAMADKAGGERRHVLLVDIDNFKQVNDRFGHDTGDRILIRIAEAMRDLIRDVPGDDHFAARLGGEEFALFLAVESEDEADRIAERLRRAIEDVAREFAMPDLLATGSVGIAPFDRGESIGMALQRADMALYKAKQDGRNRVRREFALPAA